MIRRALLIGLAGAVVAGLAGPASAAAGDLQLRRISPTGQEVAPAQQIVFQFDRPMARLGNMARAAAEVPITITPKLACQWRWLDVSELACRLPGQATFRPATHYQITVGTKLAALDGSHLARPVTHTFTTERPKIEWTRFQRWRSPVKPTYLVRFNLPVTAQSVAKSLAFDGGAQGQVAARAEPYTKKRQGPIWLAVPDAPGAIMEIENPQPNRPLDADQAIRAARRLWLVTSAAPLAPDADYRLTVRAGLRSPLGPLVGRPMKLSDYSARLRTYGPFRFEGVDCSDADGRDLVVPPGVAAVKRCEPNSVDLRFSAPVSAATLAALRWQPRPPIKTGLAAQWHGYATYRSQADDATGAANAALFSLPFGLAPTASYSITAPAGVKDVFGRPLKDDTLVTMRTGHRAPFFDAPPRQAVLETDEPTIVPLGFTNLRALNFTRQRLFAEDFVAAPSPNDAKVAGSEKRQPSPRTNNLLESHGSDIKPDQIATLPLGVRADLDGRSGVVWGRLHALPKQHGDNGSPVFAEVTPYEVFAKLGHFNTLVWVNAFKTGKPVAGAKVRLFSGKPDALDGLSPVGSTSATTDANGLAVLPGTVTLRPDWLSYGSRDQSAYYVAVTANHNLGLLPLDYSFKRSIGESSDDTIYGDRESRYGHMRTWAVTEQGIYRPGSDVRFAVFARNVSNTTLVAPPALGYTLTVTDSAGNAVLTNKNVKLSAFGGAHAHLHIPKTAPTGWYTITLAWKDPDNADHKTSRTAGQFLVTEFVPASFSVDALLKGARFGAGATVHGRVGARLHAGGPYTEARVKFSVRIESGFFDPTTPITSGFSFDANPEGAPTSITVAQTEAELNHQGEATTQFTLPKKSPIHYGHVVFQAGVQSARGTQVADRASAEFVTRDRFIGLRTKRWLLQTGKAADIRYLVVDADGRPRAGTAVHLRLQHQDVSTVRVKNAAGDFVREDQTRWVTDDECRAVSTDQPAGCRLTPTQPGRYRMVGEIADTQGRKQTTTLYAWATGPGAITWPRHTGVRLVPDKAGYHVGDTAHVLVANPFPGARALVTVERYGVLWKKVVRLAGSAPVIDIPINKTFFPGAYLSVTIFSPRVAQPGPPDLGRPEIAMGYKTLQVVGQGGALKVAVTPDAAVHKPRQDVHVKVQVHEQGGSVPPKTRLVAVVVDQAVVDLLADGAKYYDPRGTFYAPPDDPDVTNFSLAKQLLTRLEPKWGKGQSPGGGGGASQSPGPDVRSIFKYAAYWNPSLATDAQGRAQFSFTLADNLTRWRILVIALTPGEAMGVGDASVRVNLPIQVQPALPNQVHAGDRFGAGFDVTNRTADQQHVTTRIEAKGPIAGQTARATGALDLTSYAHAINWLNLDAQKPGTITLTASAQAGKLGDAVKAHIPVTRAEAPIVAAQYGSTTGDPARVPVKLPAGALAGSAKLDVTLAPTLIGGLDGAFVSLRDNPLRTWETRLSRGVLGADYLRLKPVLGDSVRWPDATKQVAKMLESAADFQAPDGGMAFWIPRDKFVSRYLSVYTALAFNWLSDMGHSPPAGVQSRLRDYLRKHILAADKKSGNDAVASILKAGALAALAPTGTLPDGAVAAMIPDLHRLDLFGQALLAQAALAVHDQDSARTIVQSILSHAEESAGSISFNENEPGAYLDILATPLRSNCTVLDALVAYKQSADDAGLVGNTPQKLMRWVNAQKRNAGGWPNSQENVFCTTAITRYADAFETPVERLTGTVNVADKPAGTAKFISRRSPAKTVTETPPGPGQPFAVTLAHGGAGRLYYNVRLKYAVAPDSAPAADAGLTVKRAYFVQRGKNWQPVSAKTVLERGDIVRVDLAVDAPTERHHVVLTDPLPGAFEAVNRQLATSPADLPAATPGSAVLMFDYGAWPNAAVTVGGFYHRETGFDAVRFFADDLPAGHYHLIYAAQVISPGRFIAPAPQIKEIYQPDVFGRGTPQHIRVARPGSDKGSQDGKRPQMNAKNANEGRKS